MHRWCACGCLRCAPTCAPVWSGPVLQRLRAVAAAFAPPRPRRRSCGSPPPSRGGRSSGRLGQDAPRSTGRLPRRSVSRPAALAAPRPAGRGSLSLRGPRPPAPRPSPAVLRRATAPCRSWHVSCRLCQSPRRRTGRCRRRPRTGEASGRPSSANSAWSAARAAPGKGSRICAGKAAPRSGKVGAAGIAGGASAAAGARC